MKLAYLSTSKIPSRDANSVHVMKMCQAFSRLGHTVTLAVPDIRHVLELDISDPYAFYGVERCFDMQRLPQHTFKGRSWLYGWTVGRFAARLGTDVAYGRSLHACATTAYFGIPTTWEAHAPTFLWRWKERRLFQWMVRAPAFKGLVVISNALKREVLQYVPELEGRTFVAHDGADPAPDAVVPADLGQTGDRLQVGYVGHLYAGRGIEVILALAKQAPWADFHIVGGTPDAVDALKADPALPKNVRVHGFVPPYEGERLRLAFDILLAPYQQDVRTAAGRTNSSAWMSPLKLFEYMAAGKPIICSDLPVLHEVLDDGKTAVMVNPQSVYAWSTALERLRDQPGLRQRLGSAAQAQFLKKHTWLARAKQVLRFGFPD